MKYLLDTHFLIWFTEGNPKLPETTKSVIEDIDTVCFVSVASFWEIGIKISLGKLKLDMPFVDLENWVVNNRINILPIRFDNIIQLSQLPFHHRDPFDRTLIAQALSEKLTIITKEKLFEEYGVTRLW
ncbi:type II toxin-antitoxin system VapC family toxin [Runella aurantiaca]|uniref:Type II toxin-antitoxin system VapC family toxin n=1 Tax=Runella aurantiaca TaxID=2282308 RepID=A0A369I5U2_9BACT|nr:type II toxin-antitoxin system VapC family toxin [Runella aurantiaca]RDB04948.1 type II toxin-antitoxin system VapC family toxin [Runella aurantiaca]